MGEAIGWKEVLPLVVFMAAMLALFWAIIIKPVKQRQKRHQDLIAALSEGDEVVTAGGIYGKVTRLRDKTVDLEVAEGVRLRMDRRAVRGRQDQEDEA